MISDSITAAERVALAKVVKKSDLERARGELAPGRHDVDVVLHLEGPIVVQPPKSRRAFLTVGHLRALAHRFAEKHPKSFKSAVAELEDDPEAFVAASSSPLAQELLERAAAELPPIDIDGEVSVDAVVVHRLAA